MVVQAEIDCSEVERKRTRVVELSYGQEVDTTSRIIAGKLQVLKDDIVRETIDAYKTDIVSVDTINMNLNGAYQVM